jgi:hypothetical protein
MRYRKLGLNERLRRGDEVFLLGHWEPAYEQGRTPKSSCVWFDCTEQHRYRRPIVSKRVRTATNKRKRTRKARSAVR